MSKSIFIIGTGTDVGKTYVTGLILKKLRLSGIDAAYFKAAVSGNVRDAEGQLVPGDALYVKTFSGIEQPLEEMCPYVYERAVSPHLAAQIEGKPVELDHVTAFYHSICSRHDFVTVEGSGGLFCPIRFDMHKELVLSDIIKTLDIPCLLVADAGLGTINNVILTVSFARSHGIRINGILFNNFHPGDIMEEDNVKMCEYYTGLKVIAKVKKGDKDIDLSAQDLCTLYEGE